VGAILGVCDEVATTVVISQAARLPRHKTVPVNCRRRNGGRGPPRSWVQSRPTLTRRTWNRPPEQGRLPHWRGPGPRWCVYGCSRQVVSSVAAQSRRAERMGVTARFVGRLHYIGHRVLADQPGPARKLDQSTHHPGNVGCTEKRDRQVGAIRSTWRSDTARPGARRQSGVARMRPC